MSGGAADGVAEMTALQNFRSFLLVFWYFWFCLGFFTQHIKSFFFSSSDLSWIAVWPWTSESRWAMRTAVQRTRWVWQSNCFSSPPSLEQTSQKLLPRATYPIFIFCSPLHSYLSVINGNWKQLGVVFCPLAMTVLQSIRARFGAVVPWGTGSLGDPHGMSRAGSSQHPRLAVGQPWAAGAAPGIRHIPEDREGPRMAGIWHVRDSLAQWAAGRAGTLQHHGEWHPWGGWNRVLGYGQGGDRPGSWAVTVVASEPWHTAAPPCSEMTLHCLCPHPGLCTHVPRVCC